MTDTSPIRLEHRGATVLLRIDRPDRRNTLTLEVLLALRDVLKDLTESTGLRAVVLSGAGRDFSLGGDHQDFVEAIRLPLDEAEEYCRQRTQLLTEVILGLYALPFPVIAAINGQASGAGISLALACDLRIIESRAKLYIAYGAIGASTDGGMSWFLPRYVGESAATELLLLQPIVRAARALEVGLVHEVCPSERLIPRALELADSLANSAPHAVLGAKRLLREHSIPDLERHLHVEHEQFIDGLATPEFRLAVQAIQRGSAYAFGPPAD